MVQNPFNGIERDDKFYRRIYVESPMNPFNGIERTGIGRVLS